MVKVRLTKRQAREYRRRYRTMNAMTRAELRSMSPKTKLMQCAIMMGFANLLNNRHNTLHKRYTTATRTRWLRLGEAIRD